MSRVRRSMMRGMRTVLLGALGVLLLGGCQRSLFKKQEQRTQFDTFEQMRDRYVPAEEIDPYGDPQPALRARLSRRR